MQEKEKLESEEIVKNSIGSMDIKSNRLFACHTIMSYILQYRINFQFICLAEWIIGKEQKSRCIISAEHFYWKYLLLDHSIW